MQVIIFGEKGAYAHLNGRTLKVRPHVLHGVEINPSFVAVIDPDDIKKTIDVPLKNVLIVDAQNFGPAFKDYDNAWTHPALQKQWEGFKKWAKIHGYKLSQE